MKKSLKIILKINLSILLFFLSGYILTSFNFPYLQSLAGFPLLLLPTINIVWTLELLAGCRLRSKKFILSIISITPIVIAFFSYLTILFKNRSFNEFTFLISIFSLTLLTLACLLLVLFSAKREITTLNINKIAKEKHLLLVSFFVLAFLSINFLLYKFIPETDGYTYLIQLRDLIHDGKIPNYLTRPLFISLSLTLTYITKIPLYWLFKLIIPVFVSLIFLPFYFISKEKYKSNTQVIITSMLPLAIPVVSMEILTPRPQSIFILIFVIFCYLCVEFLKLKSESQIYFLLPLFLLSVIGIKIHEFFIYLVIIISFALTISIFPFIKQFPRKAVIYAGFLTFGVLGWINHLDIIGQIKPLANIFATYILHPKFNFWFITNYTNIDGNSMGWPGYSWIFYYGYNLGLLLPVILLFIILFKKTYKFSFNKQTLVPTLAFSLFFAVAEIFPRLGLAYLPDRAWLFVSLSLALIVALALPKIELTKKQQTIYCIIAFCSFFASFYLTFAKQGSTTLNEYNAAQFIKNSLPDDALIISQGGNGPMINYFADRFLVVPPKNFFFDSTDKDNKQYISTLPQILGKSDELQEKRNEILKAIEDKLKLFNEMPENDLIASRTEINSLLIQYNTISKTKGDLKLKNFDKNRPVYVLYSIDKFSGLYGNRNWWKNDNFFGANIAKFKNYYPLIYNKNGIYIWKIN